MSAPNASTRYLIPMLGPLYVRAQQFAYPILRITLGAFFIPHGCQKLFSWFGGSIQATIDGMTKLGWQMPVFWAYYIGVLEVIGGALIVLGFLTRPIAALFVGFMFVATFFVHLRFGYFWTSRGAEMPLLLLMISIVVLMRGGGRYSLDRRFGREI